MKPAVFLDRDGTICEQMGYINHPSRLVILPGVPEAIRVLNEKGFYVIVVSNQSGVARGYFPESLVQDINKIMVQSVLRQGGRIDAVYYCPHHPHGIVKKYAKRCECRKPDIGLINQALKRFPIDMGGSWVVGDTCSDLEMARNAGLKGVLVKTGYGLGELQYVMPGRQVKPDYVAHDLLDAARYITSRYP